jgi:hypothetical protein
MIAMRHPRRIPSFLARIVVLYLELLAFLGGTTLWVGVIELVACSRGGLISLRIAVPAAVLLALASVTLPCAVVTVDLLRDSEKLASMRLNPAGGDRAVPRERGDRRGEGK